MALGMVTLLFNIILVLQHYIFYHGNEHDSDEEEPLLRGAKKAKFHSVDVNAEDGDLIEMSLSVSMDDSIRREGQNMQAAHSQDSLV